MLHCKSAKLISKKRDKKDYYYIRLNVIDSDNGKYRTKDIFTDLTVSVRHKREAEKMIQPAIDDFNSEQLHSPVAISNSSSSSSNDNITPVQSESVTSFSDYCDYWLENKRDTIRITTYEGYGYKIAYIKEFFKDKSLQDIKPQDVRDFYHYLFDHPKTCHTQDKETGLSDRSISDIAKLLRSILEDAVALDYLDKSPASRIKIPQRHDKPHEKSFVSQDEVQIFKECIHGHKLERLFLFALFFGLRRGELIGLKWKCIRDGQLHIEHTIVRMKTIVARDQVKTEASNRGLPIPEEYQDMLNDIYSEQQMYKKFFGNAYHDEGYIFTREDGTPYSPDYVTKQFKKIVRSEPRLSNDLTLHSLRRSCITALLTAGIPIKTVQKWAGHSDFRTTLNIYAQTDPSTFAGASDALINYIYDTPEDRL